MIRCMAPTASVLVRFENQCKLSVKSMRTLTTRNLSGGPEPAGANADAESLRKSDHAHCVDLVRQRDLDGYLCGLLMPPASRAPFFALRAFNVEVASVKDGGAMMRQTRNAGGGGGAALDDFGVSDSTLGQRLRIQWWRDGLAEMYGDEDEASGVGAGESAASPAGFMSSQSSSRKLNPVVRELSRAVAESGLTRRFLERLVDAREADLDVGQPDTVLDVVRYAEATQSSLLYLSLECVGVRHSDADEVASYAGVGLGLVGALRSSVYRAAALGELSVPAELMEKHGVPRDYLMNPPRTDMGRELTTEEIAADAALREAVKEMAHTAGAYLSKARGMQTKVPKEGRAALLPAVGALTYLRQLEGVGFDVLHHDLLNRDGFKVHMEKLKTTISLGRAWATGVF